MIELTDTEFEEITAYVRDYYGVNLEKKRPLIEGRLGFFISAQGFKSYHDYFEHVKSDTSNRALTNLLNKLTTNHTFFMRESEHFDFYKETVLPWVESTQQDRDLRVWSAGCATGQEPYALAMIHLDYFGAKRPAWESTVLASDISEKALNTAKNGIYSTDALEGIPDGWRQQYFSSHGDGFCKVSKKLRQNVAYKRFNLLDPFNVKRPFHAIFCRNVMIYFDRETKIRVIQKFHDALRPEGFLFIGHSESLSTLSDYFEYVRPSIYQKK
jgi:chemotaxis protein methyltransferase CheR